MSAVFSKGEVSPSVANFERRSIAAIFRRTSKADALLVFLAILVSGSLVNLVPQLLVGLSVVIFFLVIFVMAKRQEVNRLASKRVVPLVVVVFVIFFAKLFLQMENALPTLSLLRMVGTIILSIIILLYFSSSYGSLVSSLYVALIAIMVHAMCSLIFWLLFNGNLVALPEIGYETLYGVFYYNNTAAGTAYSSLISIAGFEFQRNAGIFWEPGILQIYMNILLFMSLFVFKHPGVSIVAAVMVLSTWSSTGLGILCMQVFFYLGRTRARPGKAMMLGALLMIILVFFVGNVTEKVFGDRAGSAYARALDTATALNIIGKHALFGIDVDWNVYRALLDENVAAVEMAGTFDAREASDTNSILNYFVFFGVPIGSFVLYSLFKQRLFQGEQMIFGLLIVMAIATEPIGFFLFPWMLVFSGYVLPDVNRLRNRCAPPPTPPPRRSNPHKLAYRDSHL